MATQPRKSFTTAIILTTIPIIDMLGVNWFYMGHWKIGTAKLSLLFLYILSLNIIGPEVPGALSIKLSILVLMILWWLIDIPLFASGKIRPKGIGLSK